MSESKAGARPSQVTMAGGMAVMGSALLVLTLFDSVSRLHSVEMRESITSFLSKPPGDGLGITVSQTVELLRGLMLFTAAVAAAATVLAVYVLLRHNAARICFTVAAALMLLTAPVSGGVLPVLVAFAAVTLWTRPARDWFAGRAPAEAPASRNVFTSQSHPPDDAPPSSSGTQVPAPRADEDPTGRPEPRATHGFGSPDAAQAPSYPPPPSYPDGQQPAGQVGYPAYGGYPAQPVDPDKRPVSVTVAAALTWVFAGITGFVYVLLVVMLLVAKDRLISLIRDAPQLQGRGFSTNDLVAAMWAASAIMIFWCLASMVLAFLAMHRQNWARIALVVSAGVAFLVALAGFPVSLLNMVAAVATIVLLFTGGAIPWFRGESRPRGVAPYPPQQGWHPDQAGQQYPGQAPKPQRPSAEDEKEPPSNVW